MNRNLKNVSQNLKSNKKLILGSIENIFETYTILELMIKSEKKGLWHL